MALNPRSRLFKVIFAVLAVLVVYKMVFYFGIRPTTVALAPLDVGEAPVQESAPEEEEVETTTDELEAAPPAKRIVHVPDIKPNDRSVLALVEEKVTASNVAELSSKSLALGLEGNITAAAQINRVLDQCEFAPTTQNGLEGQIESTIMNHASWSERGLTMPPEGVYSTGLPGHWLYPDDELNRRNLTEWFNGCRQMRKVFNDALRKQLDELAQQGDAMARYIYAIWVPRVGPDIKSVNHLLEWSAKAFNYTNANLVDGEVVGLLAFAQSFEDGIFTRRDKRLSNAMVGAAVTCGLDPASIQSNSSWGHFLNGDYGTSERYRKEMEQTFALADELANYCR